MKKIVLFCILILLIVIVVINKYSMEGFANEEKNLTNLTEIIWENKLLKLDTVVNSLKKSLAECGVSNITLENNDFNVIDTRKRLIELLPVTKLLDKITYNQIQCFVSKFDPENYLVISKTVSTVPKILRPRNILIVNENLYQSTPYGVVKYKISQLSEYKGLDALNASIECGVLNDFNTFNTTTDPIFHLDGKIIQKRGKQFVDIRNNDLYEITNINNKIELLNKKIINKFESDKLQNNQVTNKINQENILNNSQIKKIVDSKVLENMVDVGGIIELNINDPTNLKVIDSKTFIPVVTTTIKKALDESNVRSEVTVRGEIVISSEETISKVKDELATKGLVVSEETISKIKDELAAKGLVVSEETISKIKDELAAKGLVVSEETISKIKDELATKGLVVSEETIKTRLIVSEETITKVKDELTAKGFVVSEETIKQVKDELSSKGLPISQETIKQILSETATQVTEEDKINKMKLLALRSLEESKIKARAPIIKSTDVDITKLVDTLVSIFEYDGIIYMTDSSVVRPYSSWAIKLNAIIAKNKFQIKGVIPHFYYLNNVFNYRLLFILTDDFYIWVNKENVSEVLDIKKEFNITFSGNVPDTLGCEELKIILEQMEKANIVTREKSELIIKNYRC